MNGDLLPDIFLARSIYPSYVGQPTAYKLELNILSALGVLADLEKGVSFKTQGDVYFEIYSEWGQQRELLKIGEVGYEVTEFDSGEFVGVKPNLRSATFKVKLSPDDPRVTGLKDRPKKENFGIYIGYDTNTK